MTNCCAEINKKKSMRHIVSQRLHYHREFPTKLWQHCFPIVVKALDYIHDSTCVKLSFKYNLFPSCGVSKKIRYVFFSKQFSQSNKSFRPMSTLPIVPFHSILAYQIHRKHHNGALSALFIITTVHANCIIFLINLVYME